MIKVTANNIYGDSEKSDASTPGPMLLVPFAPVDLTNDAVVTAADQIKFSWTQGADSGSPVLDYFVYYDQGTNDYILLT